MSQSPSASDPSTSRSMLRRASEGDTESWQLLAQVYGPIVYRWARNCGCQSADAADVMQETFSAVSAALPRFDHQRDGATFRGWLWTIARNKIRDLHRASEAQAAGGTEAQLRFENQPADVSLSDDPPTEAATDFASARRRMIELLRPHFDPRSWRMFWETTVVGRDPADVAEEMAVSRWAVYKARARVLQRLKSELEGLE